MANIPFFTVTAPSGEEGSHYIVNLHDYDNKITHVVDLYDGDDVYWELANLIDKMFPTEA